MARFIMFGGLLVAMQVCCAVHAVRRGRSNWIWMILFFPLVGTIVYAINFLLPDIQHSNTVKETGDKIVRTINPSREILRLKKQVEFSDTVSNRQLLGHEYMKVGMYKEAISTFESCLEGVYEDDPEMIFDLAKAYFMNQSYKEAEKLLLEMKNDKSNRRGKQASLYLARIYGEQDQPDKAYDIYESLLEVFPGEELRCRYALLLKKNGDLDSAKKQFNDILYGAKQSPRYYRKAQKKWINIAKENLFGKTG